MPFTFSKGKLNPLTKQVPKTLDYVGRKCDSVVVTLQRRFPQWANCLRGLGGAFFFGLFNLLFVVIHTLCEFFEDSGKPVFDKGHPAGSILDLVENERELFAPFHKVG